MTSKYLCSSIYLSIAGIVYGRLVPFLVLGKISSFFFPSIVKGEIETVTVVEVCGLFHGPNCVSSLWDLILVNLLRVIILKTPSSVVTFFYQYVSTYNLFLPCIHVMCETKEATEIFSLFGVLGNGTGCIYKWTISTV